jgi:hypothetical protein
VELVAVGQARTAELLEPPTLVAVVAVETGKVRHTTVAMVALVW